MWNYEESEYLAATWVEITTRGRGALLPEHTLERPYGWVFFYQSKRCLETGQARDAFIGNAPIIVNAHTNEIRVTGTARQIEHYLTEYEATLPRALLKGVPGRRKGEGVPPTISHAQPRPVYDGADPPTNGWL